MEENLGVMSIGFLLSSPDDAVIWRGPKKNGKINTHHVLTYMVVTISFSEVLHFADSNENADYKRFCE